MLVLLCAAISGSAQAEAAEWGSVDVRTAGARTYDAMVDGSSKFVFKAPSVMHGRN
jgi:TRAP-type C4-dicarboxylate transport system permease large subunit